MLKSKKFWLSVSVIILALLSWGIFAWHSAAVSPQSTHNTVTVKPLTYTSLPLKVIAYGQVVSPTSVNISAQTNGVIAAIYFKPGEEVRQGQVLFTLQSNDTSAQVAQLKAQAEYAKEYYLRDQQLQKSDPGAISEIDVLQAQSTYQQAFSQYEEASSIQTIAAPVSGVISDTDLSPGDFVTTGKTLAVLVSSDEQVKYTLPSSEALQAKVGQPIVFTNADTQQIYSGVVVYVAPLLSNTDYTITVRADLTAKQQPLLNTFGQVVQTLSSSNKVLAVPQSLVQNDAQGFYVYLLKDHQVGKQYFQPGQLTEKGLMVATSGLVPEMQLITSDPTALSVNETVQVSSS